MKFKQWMIIEAEIDHRINDLTAPFVFFFKKGKELFGAGEDSRVVFAKIKHPDDEIPDAWKDEANFSAHNLNKSMIGEPSQNVFSIKDMKSIKILDKDEVCKMLQKEIETLGEKAFPKPKSSFNLLDLSRFLKHDPDDAPNFTRADED